MRNDRDSGDWWKGFNAALSGWADIPPAGADQDDWRAGWREGRTRGVERQRQARGSGGVTALEWRG